MPSAPRTTRSGALMHHPPTGPDDDSGALFGLDALDTGAQPAGPRDGPLFRDSAAARRLLPVREIHAEPAAAASRGAGRSCAASPTPGWSPWTPTGASPDCTATRATSTAGSDQGRDARPRGEEDPHHPPQRPVRRLDRPRRLQRLRDGLRLLLRPAPQGLRQSDHRLHQHRPDHRPPGPPHRTPGAQAGTEPVRRPVLGVRHRGERRLLGGRTDLRQHRRPRARLHAVAHRQGVLRDQVRQPRPARARPARTDADPLLPHAAGRLTPPRRADLARRRARRRRRGLPGRRLRSALQPLARGPPPRLAGRLGGAAAAPRRRPAAAGEAAGRRGGHHADAQPGPARGQPRLAPPRGGRAVAAGAPAGQAFRERSPQRPLPQR